MIFVSVGSMFPFERLVRAVDTWARQQPENSVLIQIGDGDFEPEHARWVRMLPPQEFQRTLAGSRIFVAHLGMGSLISGMQAGIPTILMPRLRDLGEHNTDHQLNGARWIRGKPGIWVADDELHLIRLLDELVVATDNQKPAGVPAHASEALIRRVRNFIDGQEP